MNVWFRDGQWKVRGENVGRQLVGRSSFKIANLLSMHFAGLGDEYPGGAMNVVEEWIEHNQMLFGREHVVLRVFGETAGWESKPAGTGMFGSPAEDMGIHDVESYVNLCKTNSRVTELTELHSNVLREAFKLSQETGCIWEWCDIATLKHTDGLCTGVCDHVIRQMAEEQRMLMEEFPKAAFVVNAINEWDAHNSVGYKLDGKQGINPLADRWYRWVSPDSSQKKVSFTAPAPGWEPEQWPEAMLIVDHGGKDTFDYECGIEAGKFQMGAIHPVRKGTIKHDGDPDAGDRFNGREWYEIPDEMYERLRSDARGAPIGATESMYFITKDGTEGWYGNANGWNRDLSLQLTFYENCCEGGHPNSFDYFIVHDDIGAQTDASFCPGTDWEAALGEMFGGDAPGPGPDPPDPGPVPPEPGEPQLKVVRNDGAELVIERDPEVIVGGDEANILRDHIDVPIPAGRRVERILNFHGLDRGDIVEMDTEIHANGKTIFARSEHKETPGNFDAYRTVDYADYTEEVRNIEVHVLCRVNGENETLSDDAIEEHRDGNRLTARPHFGVRVVWK